ncbi:MAG TPA: AAA family ATPase [Solirubrobacteraceae bacterium]|nr:AAA family ATPase [Solirubrobacteraceae bacterium]
MRLAAIDGGLGHNGSASNGSAPALYSIADLAALPKPTYLLDGILPAGGFAVAYGPSGIGKSFLALDWALCVASGLRWYGRQTQRGAVLYIAAEGAGGLYQRVEAWMVERHEEPPALIRFLPVAVNLLEGMGLQAVEAAVASLPATPVLVVVDTVARCMVGGDENSARDMGRFIAAADAMRQGSGAAVLVVHHTGKDGEDERGSSTLRAAADTMLALKPDGANVRLTCTKQKDAAQFEDWRLHLHPVAHSCVLRSGTTFAALSGTERKVLEGTAAGFGTTWVSPSTLLAELGIPKTSFFRTLKSLVDRGLLEQDGGKGRARYRLSDEGQRRSSANESHGANGTECRSTSQHPLPEGERGLGTGTGTGTDDHDADAELARVQAKFGDKDWPF